MFEQLDRFMHVLQELASGHRAGWPHWIEICPPNDFLENGLHEAVDQSEYQQSLDRLEECWRLLKDSDAQSAVDYCLKIHHMSDPAVGERLYSNARARIATALAAVAAKRCMQDRHAASDLVRWLQEAAFVLACRNQRALAMNLDCDWTQCNPSDLVRQACSSLQTNNKDLSTNAAQLWTLDLLGAGDSDVQRSITVPVAGCDNSTGFVLDLGLALIQGMNGDAVEHPRMALRTFGTDMLEAVKAVASIVGVPFRWELHSRDPKFNALALDGPSLGGALAVGLEVLRELRPYDRLCVVVATLRNKSTGIHTVRGQGKVESVQLKAVAYEQEKLDAIFRAGIRRAVVAQDTKIQGLPKEGFTARGLEIRECKRVSEAVDFASGQLTELQAVLLKETERVLRDATRALGDSSNPIREFKTWEDLDSLFVPVRVARGPRPRLSQAEYEEMERQRREGQYNSPDEPPWQRHDTNADTPIDLRAERAQQQLRRRTANWEDFRFKMQSAVVLSDPGFGKTMLLWHEVGRRNQEWLRKINCGEAGLGPTEVAVFVRAIELAQWIDDSKTMLEALLTHRMAEWYYVSPEDGLTKSLSDATLRLVGTKLSEGKGLLAIDALDEVPSKLREKLDRALAEFGRMHPAARILLSSRLVGYTPVPIQNVESNHLEIMVFEPQQMKQAVMTWFAPDSEAGAGAWQHIQSQMSTFGDLHSPLLLRLACQLMTKFRGKSTPLPHWETRSELYESFLIDGVHRWTDVAHPGDTAKGLFLDFAGDLALELWKMDARRTLWALRDLARKVNLIQRAYTALGLRPDLVADLCRTGILSAAGPNDPNTPLMFTHRSFGEYLVARCLADRLTNCKAKEWRLVGRKAWDANWEQVFLFLAANLSGHEAAFRQLIGIFADQSADDILGHRFMLAAKCLSELSGASLRLYNAWGLWELFFLLGQAPTPRIRSLLPVLARAVVKMNEWLLGDLAKKLGDPDDEERVEALVMLTVIKEAASRFDIIDRLPRLLRHPNASVREMAVRAVCAMRVTNDDVLAGLLELLSDPVELLRNMAMRGLAFMREEAAGTRVEDRLIERLADPNALIRAGALGALGASEALSRRREIFGCLLKLLNDSDSEVRRRAIHAISIMSDLASEGDTVGRIWWLVGDPELHVRVEAAGALIAIRAEQASCRDLLDSLEQLLSHPDENVRFEAIYALSRASVAHCGEVLEKLTQLLRDGEERIVGSAIIALGAMGGAACHREILDEFVRLLRSENRRIVVEVANSLAKMGACANYDDIIGGLLGVMSGSEIGPPQWAAMRALARVGAARNDILDLFLEWLSRLDTALDKDRFGTALFALAETEVAAARDDLIAHTAWLLELERCQNKTFDIPILEHTVKWTPVRTQGFGWEALQALERMSLGAEGIRVFKPIGGRVTIIATADLASGGRKRTRILTWPPTS